MKELLTRIKSLRVLVVGGVMLDRYVNGEVCRISPEAGSRSHRKGRKSLAGGAASVGLNAASLGAKVEVVGWFGNDLPEMN